MSFDDPRLAVVYDVDNPDGPDHDFFRALAAEHDARTIVDLGCGTGILTVTLVGPGRRVIGIDPATAALERARNRPGGQGVEWIAGTAAQLPPVTADLVLMTGNVAMHILGADWTATLVAIAKALRPGGLVAFESRNPQARAWEQWNSPLAERHTPVGALREATVTTPPDADGVVTMHCHNEFIADGEVIDIDQRLQFRSHEQICADLERAGLRVVATYRDWARTPFTGGADQPLMVFVAERPGGRAA